jgi:large subunit ribosomal protein L2
MAVRKLKPITPSQRHKIAMDYSDLSKVAPEKSLMTSRKNPEEVITPVK